MFGTIFQFAQFSMRKNEVVKTLKHLIFLSVIKKYRVVFVFNGSSSVSSSVWRI